MRRDRAREFLFEPARFKNDLAVMNMTLAGRGAYAILFCECWDMPEPGVLPDDDVMLATFARTDLDSWRDVREEVSKAFDTTSRPGFWVQRGTVETYERQCGYFETKEVAGRQGGIASGEARRKQRRSRRSSTGSSSIEPVGVVGVVGVEKEKDSCSDSKPLSDSDGGGSQNRSQANWSQPRTNHPGALAQIEALEKKYGPIGKRP